jgi:hypothetical protein
MQVLVSRPPEISEKPPEQLPSTVMKVPVSQLMRRALQLSWEAEESWLGQCAVRSVYSVLLESDRVPVTMAAGFTRMTQLNL